LNVLTIVIIVIIIIILINSGKRKANDYDTSTTDDVEVANDIKTFCFEERFKDQNSFQIENVSFQYTKSFLELFCWNNCAPQHVTCIVGHPPTYLNVIAQLHVGKYIEKVISFTILVPSGNKGSIEYVFVIYFCINIHININVGNLKNTMD
jgi:hypothetical protein